MQRKKNNKPYNSDFDYHFSLIIHVTMNTTTIKLKKNAKM